MSESCVTCRFFRPLSQGEQLQGRCHLNPPQFVGKKTGDDRWGCWSFPIVLQGDWCGQFQSVAIDDSVPDVSIFLDIPNGLSVRSRNLLEHEGLLSAKAIQERGHLEEIRQLGLTSKREIISWLAYHGFSLPAYS